MDITNEPVQAPEQQDTLQENTTAEIGSTPAGEPEPAETDEPRYITINVPDYDPELDPDNPDFDLEKWKASIDSADLTRLYETMRENGEKLVNGVRGLLENSDRIKAVGDTLRENWFNSSVLAANLSGLLSPDFILRVQENFLKLAAELPPEEQEALREELKAVSEPVEDENQISLFDEPETTDPDAQKDFIQLFGEPAKEKPRRKTPKRDALIEQATEDTIAGYILQGKATNALTKARPTKNNTSIDPITGDATITSGDITLKIRHYTDMTDPRTSTYQLLDAITETLTRTGAKTPQVALPLTEYMEKRGLRDRKETRKQVEEDLETIYNASISLTETRSGKEQSFLDMRICEAKGIRNGIINFSFGSTFYSLVRGYAVMPYPQPLYKINGKRNPNSYALGRRISEHKNMNAGKKNEDIIAVKTLLRACEGLPKKAELKSRQYKQLIIEPFERDLDALGDVYNILTWEYCHSNGTPLTDEELEIFDYDTFESALILIHWIDYPDQTQRLADRQARIDEAKAAKQTEPKKRGRPPKAPQN